MSTSLETLVPFDLQVRERIFATFVEAGRPPTVPEVTRDLDSSTEVVSAAFRRLALARIIVTFPDSSDIRMAHPFSAVPTHFRVDTTAGSWWANCAWCALGVPAMLRTDARVFSVCAHCLRPICWQIRSAALADPSGLIHIAIPAREWWQDIVQTCGTILAFCSAEHLQRWLETQGRDQGAVLTPEQGWRLAQGWYGDRGDPDWRRKTSEEAQALFGDLGLVGEFWELAQRDERVNE